MKQRDYRYGERFMSSGGIYGRARTYGRVRRVFRTVIHIRCRDPDFTRNSANAQAFNAQQLHVLLAYQMRTKRWGPPPPPSKALPAVVVDHGRWKTAA